MPPDQIPPPQPEPFNFWETDPRKNFRLKTLLSILFLIIITLISYKGYILYTDYQEAKQQEKYEKSYAEFQQKLESGYFDSNPDYWQTYRNEEYGFEIQLPTAWHQDECDIISGTLIGLGSDQNLLTCGTDAPSHGVVHIVAVRKETTLRTAVQQYESKTLKDISITSIEVGNNPATRIEGIVVEPEGGWIGKTPPPNTKSVEVLTYKDGVLYIISSSDDRGDLGQFNQILSTFKFIEPSKTPATTPNAEGQFCGGIAGILCPKDYICAMEGSYPDAGGKCVYLPYPESKTN